MKTKTIILKIFYGSIFIVVIPVLLIIWANFTASNIQLPVPANQILNYTSFIFGGIFIISGMLNLWIYGKGLPMNAFPPKYFVSNGVYSITKNPIYLGSIILCFSFSAIMQSSSGFWLISPIFTLMIIAYTIGFENERTTKVVGHKNYSAFLSIVDNSEMAVSNKDRVASYFIVFLPWLLIYEAFIFL
ncbi:MAG: methyltransferase [Bacteroidales bacterium]